MRDTERISDDERKLAIDDLITQFADGRIDVTEFDYRTSRIVDAKTRGELAEIVSDLHMGEGGSSPVSTADPEADRELAELRRKGDRSSRVESVITAIAFAYAILDISVLKTGYFWAGFLVLAAAMVFLPNMFGLSDEEAELYDELKEGVDEEKRIERLRAAAKRQGEIGA